MAARALRDLSERCFEVVEHIQPVADDIEAVLQAHHRHFGDGGATQAAGQLRGHHAGVRTRTRCASSQTHHVIRFESPDTIRLLEALSGLR